MTDLIERLTMIELFKEMLRCGTPIVPISTLDPGETMAAIVEKIADRPFIMWDIVRGHQGINDGGKQSLMRALPPPDPATGEGVNVKALTQNPVDALSISEKFAPRTITFYLFTHNYLQSEAIQQAIWNKRDSNKSSLRCDVHLAPAFDWPATLAQDVMPIDEPAPSAAMLEGMVEATRVDFNKSQKKKGMPEIPPYEPEAKRRAADAALGLSASAADQAFALNTTAAGLNITGLWDVKINKIGQIKGMSVHRGRESMDDYVGYEYAKETMLELVNGTLDPGGLWLWDEIDKDFAGNAGDNTGVSQELHGKVLKFINNLDLPCILMAGVWGTGKTELVKCLRNSGKGGERAMLESSLAEMKSGVVGSSMTAFLTGFKTGMAITGNRPLLVFTANSLAPLSPEFRSRMLIEFFFERPTETQVAALWKTYMRKFELPKQEIPESDGWVGREVRKCCRLSSVLKIPLVKAARAIVPQTIASARKLNMMRSEANNSLTDANVGGYYVYKAPEGGTDPRQQRAFDN
jgi:hypothetical protein